MPKTAVPMLVWNPDCACYLFYQQDDQDHSLLQGDDTAWFIWLHMHRSLVFQGKHGRFNLLKEARPRGGEGYW